MKSVSLLFSHTSYIDFFTVKPFKAENQEKETHAILSLWTTDLLTPNYVYIYNFIFFL